MQRFRERSRPARLHATGAHPFVMPSKTTSLVQRIGASATALAIACLAQVAADGVASAQPTGTAPSTEGPVGNSATSPAASPLANAAEPPIVVKLEPIHLGNELALATAVSNSADAHLDAFVLIDREGHAKLDDQTVIADLRTA